MRHYSMLSTWRRHEIDLNRTSCSGASQSPFISRRADSQERNAASFLASVCLTASTRCLFIATKASDVRYFLDTEYNGFGGALISIALVPEIGDSEFYATVPLPETLHPWVVRHVIPYLRMVPDGLHHEMTMAEVADEISHYLARDRQPVIVADWPEDIAHFCALLVQGPGEIIDIATTEFQLLRGLGFSAAANSRVPHNALHDARALREFVISSATER